GLRRGKRGVRSGDSRAPAPWTAQPRKADAGDDPAESLSRVRDRAAPPIRGRRVRQAVNGLEQVAVESRRRGAYGVGSRFHKDLTRRDRYSTGSKRCALT